LVERFPEEDEMKCTVCRSGETEAGTTTVVLERGRTVVIIRDVPAEVCGNCGEYWLDESTTERVLGHAEDAVTRNAEVEIVRYAA
jgi:YgiT-type zinc finger domain-containing protein